MKRLRYILTLLCTAAVAFSCNDWLTVRPSTVIEAEKLLATDDGIRQALNGAYLRLRNTCYGPASQRMGSGGLVERLAASYYSTNTTTDLYYWSNHMYGESPGMDNTNNDFMITLYNVVANLNTLINGMEKHEDRLDTRTYSLVRGEALALRALVHFDLMRVYGPVPAAPDASVAYLPYVTDNHYMAYTYETYDRFMELMFMDMDEAERLLKEYDPVITMSWDETEIENYTWHYRKSRLNYYGVLGLQARMHLWMGGDTHKSEALRYANLVKDAMEPDGATPKFRLTVAADIESGAQYSDDRYYYFEHLAGVLCDNFDYLNDGDIIWKSGSLTSNHPTFATLMVNGNTSDLRYKVGVESTYISTPRPGRYVYAMKKGKSFHAASNASKNFPIIRFAEIYFILMELNSLSEANILYQEYCDTRDITYVPMTDETRAETLLHESIREFFGEGQNFFTYKRNRVRNIWFTDNECSDEMYRVPIPTAELLSTDLTIE